MLQFLPLTTTNEGMSYKIRETKRYKKSYRRVRQRKGFKQEKLDSVVNTLLRGECLAPVHEDHPLTGELEGVRECHVQPNVLLMYYHLDNVLVLVLVNIGSHHELFGK